MKKGTLLLRLVVKHKSGAKILRILLHRISQGLYHTGSSKFRPELSQKLAFETGFETTLGIDTRTIQALQSAGPGCHRSLASKDRVRNYVEHWYSTVRRDQHCVKKVPNASEIRYIGLERLGLKL